MKTKCYFIATSFILINLLLSGCGPYILKADFDSDVIGGLPNLSLPGNPDGDEIRLPSGSDCDFSIVNSPVFDSKALRSYTDFGYCFPTISFRSADVAPSNDHLDYYFELYRENIDCRLQIYASTDLAVPVEDASSTYAFGIELSDGGQITLISDGTRNIGTYAANQKLIFLASIDRSTNSYTLTIFRDGASQIVIANEPIHLDGFWSRPKYFLTLAQVPYNCDASSPANSAYVVDNVRISKKN